MAEKAVGREKGSGMQKKFGVHDMAFIGVMSAAVFAANFISLPLGDVTRIHFGNVFCVLSGLLLGSVKGGLCAGIGSFFYDLTNPIFVASSPITFLTKFVLGFVTGAVSRAGGKQSRKSNIIGALLGSVSYVILYLLHNFIKQYFLIKNPLNTVMALMVTKGAASLINGVIAVVVAVLLYPVLKTVIVKSGSGGKI